MTSIRIQCKESGLYSLRVLCVFILELRLWDSDFSTVGNGDFECCAPLEVMIRNRERWRRLDQNEIVESVIFDDKHN
jgi:hypothetical protein